MNLRANPDLLRAFLADPARPKDTLRYHELQGFLFALASGPDLVMPSEWMPEIFGGGEAEYASLDEMEGILGAIMALYNEINGAVLSRTAALPSDCTFRLATLDNLLDDAPVSEWARGFTRGHMWLEASWEDCVPDDLDEESGTTLMVLSFFSSRRFAEDLLSETGKPDLPAFAETVRRLLPDAIFSYALLGRSIAEARRAAEHTPRRAAATPGRNDPCVCGSGRKYKKCCGAG